MSEPGPDLPKQVVQVTLIDYWYEAILREEALARLAERTLDHEIASSVAAQIPDSTDHYLTFHGDAFREYVRFSDEQAGRMVLLLPLVREDDTMSVVVPLHPSVRPRTRPESNRYGIDIHQFRVSGDLLFENGEPRDSFRHEDGPTMLTLDVSFVEPRDPRLAKHPGGSRCCDACEWVHSKLDIHCADRICCLGTCD